MFTPSDHIKDIKRQRGGIHDSLLKFLRKRICKQPLLVGFVASFEDAWPVSTLEYGSKSKWPYHKTRVHTVCINSHPVVVFGASFVCNYSSFSCWFWVILLFGPPWSSEATCFEANAVVMIATHALPLLHKRSSAPTCVSSIQTESKEATTLLVGDSLLRKQMDMVQIISFAFICQKQPLRNASILTLPANLQYTPSNKISRHQRLKSLERLNATFLKTKSKWCEFEVVPWSTQLDLEIVGQTRRFVNSQIKRYKKCKHIKCALGPNRCTKVYYVQNNHPVLGLFYCSRGHPCAGSILDLHRSSKGTIFCRF